MKTLQSALFHLILFGSVLLLSACGNSTTSNVPVSATSSWSSATLLINNARYPQIGADGNGNMIAIWMMSDGLYSGYFDSKLGWETPQKIAERTTQNVSFTNLHLAVNAKGDAVAAWVHEEIGNYSIQTAKYTPGSGWGAPQKLIPSSTVISMEIALDSNSDALIVWKVYGFPTTLFASRSSSTSEWDVARSIGTNILDVGDPRLAVDHTGNALVVWAEGEYVYVNRYTANEGWGIPQQISTNTGGAVWTNIAFDQSGNALAIWCQSDASNHLHIYSSRYTGNSWVSSYVIDGNTLDSIEPALAVDSEGNFLAVWVQFNGTGSDIYSSRYIASSGWDSPRSVGSGGNARSPRVVTDAMGNAFAAWQQYDPNDIYSGDAKVYVNRFKTGTGWGTSQRLNYVLGGADIPEIAVDAQGHAAVIWSQGVGETSPGSGVVKYGVFSSRFQ